MTSNPTTKLPRPVGSVLGIDTDFFNLVVGSPENKGPANAFDGDPDTPYLNYGDYNSGLEFQYEQRTNIAGFILTSGPDRPEFDPTSYKLYGYLGGAWRELNSGSISLSTSRRTASELIPLANASYATAYRLIFPGLRGERINLGFLGSISVPASDMQIGELEMHGTIETRQILPAPITIRAIDLDGNSNSGVVGEGPEQAFDDRHDTKYWNGGDKNSGIEFSYAKRTRIEAFQIVTGNDFPARDPASYLLQGFQKGTGQWITVSAGNLELPSDRERPNPLITVTGNSAFTQWRLSFPTTRDSNASSLQLSELILLGTQLDPAAVALQGGGAVLFDLDPADLAATGLAALAGLSGRAANLYGLRDVQLRLADAGQAGSLAVSGSGSWAGTAVQFSGRLIQSDGVLTLVDVQGSVDLSQWLGNHPHLKQHSNGSIRLDTTAATPQFALEGYAQLWLEPGAADRAAPLAVKLHGFSLEGDSISAFRITPEDLQTPFQLALGDARLEQGRTPLQYRRSADGSGYTISLEGTGTMRMPEAEPLAVAGKVTYAGRFGPDGSIGTAPTRADFEIVSTRPFEIARTLFTSIGGLKLSYEEDAQRRLGALALRGSNTINLERLDDVKITLGREDFDLAQAMATAGSLLGPSEWTLGSLDDAADVQSFDLGILKIKDIDLKGVEYLNRSLTAAAGNTVDPHKTLVETLAGGGLFRVDPLYATVEDRITLYGLNGTPVSEVVLEISAAAVNSAVTTVSRTQQLSSQEKLNLFAIKKKTDAETQGIEFSGIAATIKDLATNETAGKEFESFSNYFKAYGPGSTLNTAQYGSVNVDAQGRWTYSLNPDKLSPEQKQALGSSSSFQVTPRINVATGLTANLKELDAAIESLFEGVRTTAQVVWGLLSPLWPFVKALEQEIPGTGIDGIDNALLSLFEAVPGNAYKDGKLQVIEIIDTAQYMTRNKALAGKEGSSLSITPLFKVLGTTIRSMERIGGIFSVSGVAGMDQLDLGLLFRTDLAADDSYRWLYSALADPTSAEQRLLGGFADLAKATENTLTPRNKRDRAKGEKENNKRVQGKRDRSGDISGSAKFELDLPPLYRPSEFLSSFLTEDLLTLFEFELSSEVNVSGSVTIPTPIPLLDALLGVDLTIQAAFSILSALTADELQLLGEKISEAQKTITDSSALTKKIRELVNEASKRGVGTDLSKDRFYVAVEPFVGLRLGVPNFNISGRLGVYVDYLLTAERLLTDAGGRTLGAKDGVDQRIRYADYNGDKPTTNFSYNPSLDSLRLDIDHNYDFLLQRGPGDSGRFGSFADAYSKNSWLLTINLEPIFLDTLLGNSSVSYDKTLLAKLGKLAVDRIEWINIANSRLVTSAGVDLFFREAKLLNSPASRALDDALRRQYPELSDLERGRLLSLVVEYGKPKRISYALADSQAVNKRIQELQSAISIGLSSAKDAPAAKTDRLRLRYKENGKDASVDSYQYYSLQQSKYIKVNPVLTTNYASIDFDLTSEGTNIELDLSVYDGARWRPLGRVVDTLAGKPTITLSNSRAEGLALRYSETAKPDANAFVHNSGTLTLQMSLAHLDRPGATEEERLIKELASRGALQFSLSDSGAANSEITYMGLPRLGRGGAIYTKSGDSGAVLRQAALPPWSSDQAAGSVQWLMPAVFPTLPQRQDLAFLGTNDSRTRARSILDRLNPQAPLAVLMALQQMEGSSTSHISATQSGALASAVQGVMRFSHDPIGNTSYKSYIGADGLVRIAMRHFSGSDWVDIATLDGLQLNRDETHAPDLLALNGQVILASWNSADALVTYVIDTSSGQPLSVAQNLPAVVTLPAVLQAGEGNNQWISAQPGAKSNSDLRIGLEKRLDLSTGSSSLQKAYYLSLLDARQQVYASSANPLKLAIEGYSSVANTKTLVDAAKAWSDASGSRDQLRRLLGFGERSSKGILSRAQAGRELATVRAADFMEFASGDQLTEHLNTWGAGSLFVVAANNPEGSGSQAAAMVWNYDGDAYTRLNADRSKPETVQSSGRIYNATGMIPESIAVVYKPADQKDVLISNWQGLVDDKTAEYRQLPGSSLRTATLHTQDDLVAGGNVALLLTGRSKGLNQALQRGFSDADLGGNAADNYQYSDGTELLRYFSSERTTDSLGVYHWYDASNVAPLQLRGYTPAGLLNSAQRATALQNSGGMLGGLGWIWTPANNALERGRLESLDGNSGLGFADGRSLNLAIASRDGALASLQPGAAQVQMNSLQLLPTNQTPELLFSSGQQQGGRQHIAIKAGPVSERAVVLHGSELLVPGAYEQSGPSLSADGILASFFEGKRPYLNRGEYQPLSYLRTQDTIRYGHLNAPVQIPAADALWPGLFPQQPNRPVTPMGFEGPIADYISYSVDPRYADELEKLIKIMPPNVGDDYFQFNDTDGKPINIGTIVHGPMVPIFSDKSTAAETVLIKDLTPWTPDFASLTVRNLRDIALGRGEPDPVLLEQMRLVGTYTEAAASLDEFVDYAWSDPVLKWQMLNQAVPVAPFSTGHEWLAEFRRVYQSINIPQSLDFVSADYPALVNNTLFSPVAADALVNKLLPLAFVGNGSADQLVLKHTLGAGVNIKFGFEAWPFSGTLASWKIPFFKPNPWIEKKNAITGGPLMGRFTTALDENRNTQVDSGELSSNVNQAYHQFDVSGRLEQLLLDSSNASNTVWTGSRYEVVPQNGIPDYRSGLVITRASAPGSVVDVMTGLPNDSLYISLPERSFADTHWESVKHSALLDYIPYSYSSVDAVSTSRWFDPINKDNNRRALSKLVPVTVETAFKAHYSLPASLSDDVSKIVRVYDALAAAATSPSTAPPDLLAQYSFENRIMVLTQLVRRLYESMPIQREQLGSPNNRDGYNAEIYAYQLHPYLALTLQKQTDTYYGDLVKLIATAVGDPAYASRLAQGLEAGNYKLNLADQQDIALLLGFAVLTMPHQGLGALSYSQGRLEFSGARQTELKGLIQAMNLPQRAAELLAHLNGVDAIAATQFSHNPLLVSTAVAPRKYELLRTDGVLDRIVAAIRQNHSSSGVVAASASSGFTGLTPDQFTAIQTQIQTRSQAGGLPMAVAGLSKAMTVEQAFGQSTPGRYDFMIKLSEAAPAGGALLRLSYAGAAVYGTDYVIDGYSSRPDYVHIAAGQTLKALTIDVRDAINPSSLLLELNSASANFGISRSFNRLLVEIDGKEQGGGASLREQTDNVRLISSNGIQTLRGETVFDGMDAPDSGGRSQTIGTQPGLAAAETEWIHLYVSNLDSGIQRLRATAPSDQEISGEWLLQSKNLFRAFKTTSGPVAIYELRHRSSGIYTYVADEEQKDLLTSQGWNDLGVAFSLDENRSLPTGIITSAQPSFEIQVPGLNLQGASGYFDRYQFSEGQDISEWRFLLAVDNVAFNLADQNFSLGGSLALRERQEYGDKIFELKADVDNFKLPNFTGVSTVSPVILNDAKLEFRINDPAGTDRDARIDQWRVAGTVSNLPAGPFVLNGSLDARYENSALTRYLPSFKLSARVNDFDFEAGGLKLSDLDVTLTDLTLVSGAITAWQIDTSINRLQLVEGVYLSGNLNLNYAQQQDGKTLFTGKAALSSFDLKLGANAIKIDNGNLSFALLDGSLNQWGLAASVNDLQFGDLVKISGDATVNYLRNRGTETLTGSISLDAASINLATNLSLSIDRGDLSFGAIDGVLQNFAGSVVLNAADFGPFSIASATASINYARISRGSRSSESTSIKIDDVDLRLNLGAGIGIQSVEDVDLTLQIDDGQITSYSLAAESISLNLGHGIQVRGEVSATQKTVLVGAQSQKITEVSIEAEEISVALPGVNFKASGEAEFNLIDNRFSSVHLFAQVDQLTVGTGPAAFDLSGYLDLRLSDFQNAGPGLITISSGIDDVQLGLPGSGGVSLSGEVKDLKLIPVLNAQGIATGQYSAIGWQMFGSVEDFSIGGLFTADGYGELSYVRDLAKNTQQLKGLVAVSDFSLLLPGSAQRQRASFEGSAGFDLDYLADGSSRLNWFRLMGGVRRLTPVSGIEISGSLSLEYQDKIYATNQLGRSHYILNAGLTNSSFQISDAVTIRLDQGSLSNLVIGDDGVIYGWELTTRISDLQLYGLGLSGDLDLEYSRSSRTLTGSASVSNFRLDLDGDGQSDLPSLSGSLGFKIIDEKLSSFDLRAQATDVGLFDLFRFSGNLDLKAELGTRLGDIYTINAGVKDFSFDLGQGNKVVLNGELRNLVIRDSKSGQPFARMVRSWSLLASDATLQLEGFSLDGAAEISYSYTSNEQAEIKINAQVKEFKLPAALSKAGSIAGRLSASLVDYSGSGKPELTAWTIQTIVEDLDFAGINLTGSVNISFREVDRGALTRVGYLELSAEVKNLTLSLTADTSLNIEKGKIELAFYEDRTSSNVFAGLANPERFRIEAKVKDFTLIDGIILSGDISLAYADGLYRFDGMVSGMSLPTGDQRQTFAGSISNLVISKAGELRSWTVETVLNDFKLFGDTSLTGQASIAYTRINGADRYDLSALVRKFRLSLPEINVDLELSGAITLTLIDKEIRGFSLGAKLEGLKILEFDLSGELNLAYDIRDTLYFNRETLRVGRASVSADVFAGLIDVDVEVSNLLFVKGDAWSPVSWQARADFSLGQRGDIKLPFSLAGNLAIAFLQQDSRFSNKTTYTLSGSLDDFRFTDRFLRADSIDLELKNLVFADGQIRSVGLNGSVDHLVIGGLIEISGEIELSYFSESGLGDNSDFSITAELTGLKLPGASGYDIYRELGIESALLSGRIRNGRSFDFTADVSLRPDLYLNVGGFSFGLEKAGATIRYSSDANEIVVDISGRLQIGLDNLFPVEGSFSVSVDLDTGDLALRNLSLLLTPDNQPVDLGLIRLDPGTQLRFANNTLSLSADLAVNSNLLNAAATPIFDFINDISPAVKPIVDGLAYQQKLDGFATDPVQIKIPAIQIPEVYITGYRKIFGIRVPRFGVRLKEIIPEQTIQLLPKIDFGKIALGFFEDFPSNPYRGNGGLEVIEVIDKVGSIVFKINQTLARAGLGDAFAPYVALYGKRALTMDYMPLAPFVKTVATLLEIADKGITLPADGWLELPALQLSLNALTGQTSFVSADGKDAMASLLNSLGSFGDLYTLSNNNPYVPSNQPEPLTNSINGFIDRSSLRVPIIDDFAKTILNILTGKNVDLFEYNINLAAGFEVNGEYAIPPATTVPFIGIPLPIVLYGSFGVEAGLNASLGFSAPTKAIMQIGSEISRAIGGGGIDMAKLVSLLFKATTQENSGAYLVLSDEMVRLAASMSAGIGLDYKIAAARAQLGFSTELFAGLELKGPSQDYERLYLNNLLRTLFDPEFAVDRTPADLNVLLKLGNTKVWSDLQFKAPPISWITLARIEAKIPPPGRGLSFNLGTIYTAPGFGSNSVFFDQDLDLYLDPGEAQVYSGFRDGTANQDDLYSRISEQLFGEDQSGILVVSPSAYVLDVMTGLPRSLALLDSISPTDRLPDALTVISSLQALPALVARWATPTQNAPRLEESFLAGIRGFNRLNITSFSSYRKLSDPANRADGLAQLQLEYQLQALLLASADFLSSFGIRSLTLPGSSATLHADQGTLAYAPLFAYASHRAGLGGPGFDRDKGQFTSPFLDLADQASLRAYFDFLQQLIQDPRHPATQSLGPAAAQLSADQLARINQRIAAISGDVGALAATPEAVALALVPIKQLLQSGSFASALHSLALGVEASLVDQALRLQLQRPRSAQIPLVFATAGWQQGSAVGDATAPPSLVLSHPATELGARISLLIDTPLQYGVDYTINGLAERPSSLAIAAGERSLALQVERKTTAAAAAPIRLILGLGHSGIQVDPQANALVLAAAGDASVGSLPLEQLTALESLQGVTLVRADAQGRFAVAAAAGASQQLLLGYDPLQGHTISWAAAAAEPRPTLQLVNGTLFAGSQPIALVFSPQPGGGWQPQAYLDAAALSGATDLKLIDAAALTLTEDQAAQQQSFASLLAGSVEGAFSVVDVSGDGHLQLSRSGNAASDALSLRPLPDFSGLSQVLVTIQQSQGGSSVLRQRRLLITVTPTPDTPLQIQPLSLSTAEDTPLVLPLADLTKAFLDRDRFELVSFVNLEDRGGPADEAVAIAIDPIAQTVTLTPAPNQSGERTLTLTLQAGSGPYSITVPFRVQAVYDAPQGNRLPIPLLGREPLALTARDHFKPQDIEASGGTEGIRITTHPFAGRLLWRADANSAAVPLPLSQGHVFSRSDLDDGRLLYQPDTENSWFRDSGRFVTDFIEYSFVQPDGVLSGEPQILVLADGSNYDPTAAEEELPADTVDTADSAEPQAPRVLGFQARQLQESLQMTFSFDQPLRFRGGPIRLYLAATPEAWGQQEPLLSLDVNDRRVQLAADGRSLTISLPSQGEQPLRHKQGYLVADLVSDGTVLQDAQGLSLVGKAALYATAVDFQPPAILDHSFLLAGTSVLLQLNLSEPARLSADARVRLESIHPITAARRLVATLPIQASEGPELLVDLSERVLALELMPGQKYKLILEPQTSLTDRYQNAADPGLSHEFTLPFPPSPLFAQARAAALSVPASDLHLYFSLRDGDGVAVPLALQGFGQADAALAGRPFSLSSQEGRLASGRSFSLALDLFPAQAQAGADAWGGFDPETIEAIEVLLRYRPDELWFDPSQALAEHLVAISSVANDPVAGSADLRLRFMRGSAGWGRTDTALRLGALNGLTIPYSSQAGLPDSFPSVLVSGLTLIPADPLTPLPSVSLPQLNLNKANDFGAIQTELLLLTPSSFVIEEDAAELMALIEARSAAGLAAGEWLTISQQPNLGTLSLDSQKTQWIYKSRANAYGLDTFTLTARNANGITASQVVTIEILSRNDAPLGSPVLQIRAPGGVLIHDRAPRQGDLLVIDSSGLQDADGIGPIQYRWFTLEGEQKTPIAGAQAERLLLTAALIGKQIGVEVSYQDGGGSRESFELRPEGLVMQALEAAVVSSSPLQPEPERGGRLYSWTIGTPGGGEASSYRVPLIDASLMPAGVGTLPAAWIDTTAWPNLNWGSTSLDFNLRLDPATATATAILPTNMFGAAAVAAPVDPSTNATAPAFTGRSFFSIDHAANLRPLLYNPTTREGARFYDIDGQGEADQISLTLHDGGAGDKDGARDGRLINQAMFGTVKLTPELRVERQLVSTGTTATAPAGSSAPATTSPPAPSPATPPAAPPVAITLRAELQARPASVNTIGYVVLDADETARSQELLSDLVFLKARSLHLLSSLEDEDTEVPNSIQFTTELLIRSDQSVAFFEVNDATLDSITDLDAAIAAGRFRLLQGSEPSAGTASFRSPSGLEFQLGIRQRDQGLAELIAQEQGRAVVLDFRSFVGGETVRASLQLTREAQYDSVIHFYRVQDLDGSVLDGEGNLLTPGKVSVESYRRAALSASNRVDELTGLELSNRSRSDRSISIQESSYLAPVAIFKSQVFFAFAAANTDNYNHFQMLGTNRIGLEDKLYGGDRDHDDMTISFTFESILLDG